MWKKLFGKTPNKTVLIKIFRLRAHNLIETPQSTYFVVHVLNGLVLYRDTAATTIAAQLHINSTFVENLDLFFIVTIRLCNLKDAIQPHGIQHFRNAFKFNADKLDIPLRYTEIRNDGTTHNYIHMEHETRITDTVTW